MPYIRKEERIDLDHGASPQNAGQLNYVITIIIHAYFAEHGKYQGINDIIGALEGAKAEFQRKIVAPYEDKKISENGDVI